MVCRIHVLEEARHVSFARDIIEREVPALSRPALALHQVLTAQTSFMMARSLVHPDVYKAVGLDPREARRQALSNPHYQQTMAWAGEKVLAFLDEQGLVPRSQHRVWRRSLLMRYP